MVNRKHLTLSILLNLLILTSIAHSQGVADVAVTLDDRENHQWSYYSDANQPIHSLNPRDVKITYYGNGIGTVNATEGPVPAADLWTGNATNVKVGMAGGREDANQFVYYKTLENLKGSSATTPEEADGRYEYTTIPNPFAVRPVFVDTEPHDRGFYSWRLKGIQGGQIFTSAEGDTTLTLHDIIPPETTLYLLPDEESSMEVELEALWAKAFVFHSPEELNNAPEEGFVPDTEPCAFERNFLVLLDAANLSVSGLTHPATVTAYQPDGSSGSDTSYISGAMTCGADLKIENIIMKGENARLVTAVHNLVIGRGVTPHDTLCANYVGGMVGDLPSPQYKIRIESGTYTFVSSIAGHEGYNPLFLAEGTPKVDLVLGCDFDRAVDDNSLLDISEGVGLGRNCKIGNPRMVSEETFHFWVKSGNIVSSVDVSDYDADYASVLYVSMHGAPGYIGYRKLFIEGGVIAGVAGGVDKCNDPRIYRGVRNLTVRMTGGHVRGPIYGGGSQSPSGGNKEFIITGGTVTGWISAGCNGTSNQQGQTYGEGFIYFGGTAVCGGEGSENSINGSKGGIIYGAGNGRSTMTTSGELTYGTNVVIADEGQVEHDVYGGGNYGYAYRHSNVYVLGGTIGGSVFGGAYQKKAPETNIFVRGGTIDGSVYGGSNFFGTTSGKTTVDMSGGWVGGDVYGGGLGKNTILESGSLVNLSGGIVNGDVYGGGFEGHTTGDVIVNLSGGIIRGNLFGGAYGQPDTVCLAGMKTVNILGGRVFGNVYGGSRLANDSNDGTNNENTATTCVTNICGGRLDQNVYAAGYYGSTHGSVYLFIGKHAIQNAPYKMPTQGLSYDVDTGIDIGGTVWAGSDWGTFTGTFGAETIDGNSNVYVDGEFYDTKSTNANADHYMNIGGSILGCGTSCDAGKGERTLIIRDYGQDVPDGQNLANPVSQVTRELLSIQRFKNVVLDNGKVDLLGQGKVSTLNSTEKYSLYEISENCYLTNGSTLVTEMPSTQLKTFRIVTSPETYQMTYGVWHPVFEVVPYYDLGEYTENNVRDNKIRINGGAYLEIKYEGDSITQPYGMLQGFGHLMRSWDHDEATCAYARPKQSLDPGNIIPEEYPEEYNKDDGGFVSYDPILNTYNEEGEYIEIGYKSQLPYENHTPTRDDSRFFRIWRYGGTYSTVDGVFYAATDGKTASDPDYAQYKTVDVTVILPAWRSTGAYYRFDRMGQPGNYFPTYEWGSDVMAFNAANYGKPAGDDTWMCFDEDEGQLQGLTVDDDGLTAGLAEIDNNPNINFGLALVPGQAIASEQAQYIICDQAEQALANMDRPFTCSDNTKVPKMTFRLTYSNELSKNMTYEPMLMTFVQCDADGNVTDHVTVRLTVNTATTITQDFNAAGCAIMDGMHATKDVYTTKIILPLYHVDSIAQNSTFRLTSVQFDDGDAAIIGEGNSIEFVGCDADLTENQFNRFGMGVVASETYDEINGWTSPSPQIDVHGFVEPVVIGYASGRTEIAIDFNLYYNGSALVPQDAQTRLGTMTFTFQFDNYAETEDHNGSFTITLDLYRLGLGENYYVDGVNGKDETGYGRYPDKAAKTVNYVFYRANNGQYKSGDNIFIVDTLTTHKAERWNGLVYGDAKIYRYPGGHPLYDPSTGFENGAFTGLLVNVTKQLDIRGIVLDGLNLNAEAPIVNVAANGLFDMGRNSVLRNNVNHGDGGGAVHVERDGSLWMNINAKVCENVNGEAGGILMEGAMVVSDTVRIYDNYAALDEAQQSNVFLGEADEEGGMLRFKVIQVGTSSAVDGFGPLASTSKIGVDKTDWDHTVGGYLPILYAEEGNELGMGTHDVLSPLVGETMVTHDLGKYKLVRSTNPQYLYWLTTWVTMVTEEPEGFDAGHIDEDVDLAWVISLVNGENGQTANSDLDFNIVEDIDMGKSVWVPIGVNEAVPFSGTAHGNGHVVSGIKGSLQEEQYGLFGYLQDALVDDMVVQAEATPVAENVGVIAGAMHGGTLNQVEATGTMNNGRPESHMGGLVGENQGGTILNAISVATLSGSNTLGGMVGLNYGDLFNSYSRVAMTGNDGFNSGGLVGENYGRVENCYVIKDTLTTGGAYYAFVGSNNAGAQVNYCYAEDGTVDFVGAPVGGGDLVAPRGHGTYAPVDDAGALGYRYHDNAVTACDADTTYVRSRICYSGGRITTWPGLMSSLNQWVDQTEVEGDFAPWNRTATGAINGDLPVLEFNGYQALAQVEGSKLLDYGVLDEMLTNSAKSATSASVLLYADAVEVEHVPSDQVHVFIDDDVVLTQKAGSGDFKATVGVTFDNSCKTAIDYFGNTLHYDWHLMSTPLQDAPLGIEYTDEASNWWNTEDHGQVSEVSGGYLPEGLENVGHWDFYTYYEPQYHWINFKRNSNSHYHYDEPHGNIAYENERQLVPGKGYMVAVDKDTYLSNTGTLNQGDVSVKITRSMAEDDGEPTKDWGSNLIGNPFQAYLDLDKVAESTGYENYYVYDAHQGGYVPFVKTASQNPAILSRYVHPHQAFFILKGDVGEEEITFAEAMAGSVRDEGSYLREDRVNYPVVNLFVTDEAGRRDLAVVELDRPEAGGAIKTDALRNANFKVSAYYDRNDYGLLFSPVGAQRVPVHFSTSEEGVYTMTWSKYNAVFQSLFLVDNLTGAHVDMCHSERYQFTASPDDYDARFYITYNCTGVGEDANDFAYFNGHEWIIEGQGQLDLIDMTGRVILSRRLTANQTVISYDKIPAGVYILRLTSDAGTLTQVLPHW